MITRYVVIGVVGAAAVIAALTAQSATERSIPRSVFISASPNGLVHGELGNIAVLAAALRVILPNIAHQ
jgi:hypothetical protein